MKPTFLLTNVSQTFLSYNRVEKSSTPQNENVTKITIQYNDILVSI